jgi:hypothetical protein
MSDNDNPFSTKPATNAPDPQFMQRFHDMMEQMKGSVPQKETPFDYKKFWNTSLHHADQILTQYGRMDRDKPKKSDVAIAIFADLLARERNKG